MNVLFVLGHPAHAAPVSTSSADSFSICADKQAGRALRGMVSPVFSSSRAYGQAGEYADGQDGATAFQQIATILVMHNAFALLFLDEMPVDAPLRPCNSRPVVPPVMWRQHGENGLQGPARHNQ